MRLFDFSAIVSNLFNIPSSLSPNPSTIFRTLFFFSSGTTTDAIGSCLRRCPVSFLFILFLIVSFNFLESSIPQVSFDFPSLKFFLEERKIRLRVVPFAVDMEIKQVPDDILISILGSLISIDPFATPRISLVSRRFHRIISSQDFANFSTLSISFATPHHATFRFPTAHILKQKGYEAQDPYLFILRSFASRVSHVFGFPKYPITFHKVKTLRFLMFRYGIDLNSLFPAVSHMDIDIQHPIIDGMRWPQSLQSYSLFIDMRHCTFSDSFIAFLPPKIICRSISYTQLGAYNSFPARFPETELFSICETFHFALALHKLIPSQQLPHVKGNYHSIWFSPLAVSNLHLAEIPHHKYRSAFSPITTHDFMNIIQWDSLEKLFISECYWADLENIFASHSFPSLHSLTIDGIYTTDSFLKIPSQADVIFIFILDHIFSIQSLVHCYLNLSISGLQNHRPVPCIGEKCVPIIRRQLPFLQSLYINTARLDFLNAILRILGYHAPHPVLKKVSIIAPFCQTSLGNICKLCEQTVVSLNLIDNKQNTPDETLHLHFVYFRKLRTLKIDGSRFLIYIFPPDIRKLQVYRCRPFPWTSIYTLHSLETLHLSASPTKQNGFIAEIIHKFQQHQDKLTIPKEILEYIQRIRCSHSSRFSNIRIRGFYATKDCQAIIRSFFSHCYLRTKPDYKYPILTDECNCDFDNCKVAIFLIQ